MVDHWWWEAIRSVCDLGIPIMLFLLQRARTEQQELRLEIHQLKLIGNELQVSAARLAQWITSHEQSDAQAFQVIHEDIRELRELHRAK